LRPAEGRARAPDHRDGGHLLHPGGGPQPPGALDRARPWRRPQGPRWGQVLDRPWDVGYRRGEEPQAGAVPLRSQEGRRIGVPRRGPADRRAIQPDPVYQNPLVTQLINRVLLNGKKTVAEHIVYDALEQISQKTANDPVITLKRAVENVRPLLEVKSRRV